MPRLRYLKAMPNLYGQPGVTNVQVDHAGETWGDAQTGDPGVALDTLLFCANVAEGKEPPVPRCGWCEVARERGEPALPHECELRVPLGEVLSA